MDGPAVNEPKLVLVKLLLVMIAACPVATRMQAATTPNVATVHFVIVRDLIVLTSFCLLGAPTVVTPRSVPTVTCRARTLHLIP
jgi:hypothetical protein